MESINAMRPQSACPVLEDEQIGLYKPKPLGYYNEEYGTSNPVVPKMLEAGLLGGGQGVLEVQPGLRLPARAELLARAG